VCADGARRHSNLHPEAHGDLQTTLLTAPERFGSVETEMAARAARFVGAVEAPDSSIRPGSLDYSPESLEIVDGLLGDLHTKGVALPEDVQVDVSAYIFEVARREFGGRYLSGDDENPFVLMIGEPDFQLGVMVMSKVAGRAANGPEDNIPFFYAGIAAPVARRKSATQVRPRRSPDRNKYGRGGVRTCDLSRVKRKPSPRAEA